MWRKLRQIVKIAHPTFNPGFWLLSLQTRHLFYHVLRWVGDESCSLTLTLPTLSTTDPAPVISNECERSCSSTISFKGKISPFAQMTWWVASCLMISGMKIWSKSRLSKRKRGHLFPTKAWPPDTFISFYSLALFQCSTKLYYKLNLRNNINEISKQKAATIYPFKGLGNWF